METLELCQTYVIAMEAYLAKIDGRKRRSATTLSLEQLEATVKRAYEELEASFAIVVVKPIPVSRDLFVIPATVTLEEYNLLPRNRR